MSDLGPLFVAPPPRRVPTGPDQRKALFEAFHAENPDVYLELLKMVQTARAKGARRIGLRMCWEALRWRLTFETVRPIGAPKLNDWLTPYYSRLIQKTHPELADMLETRERDQ